MTREEFESILEEVFEEGYNQAISDIQEDVLDEEAYNLEDDYEYYTEEQDGHPRHFSRQGSLSGIKHARSTDMGRKSSKELRKLGYNVLDKDIAFKPGIDKATKDVTEKMAKTKKFQKFAKYVNRNEDKIRKDTEDKIERFKNKKLKDLKSKLSLNRLNNISKQYGGPGL